MPHSGPPGVRKGASGAGPPPTPSDGSVASDPLVVVVRRPVAIMAGTCGRMGGPDSGAGSHPERAVRLGTSWLTRIGPADSGRAAPTRISLCDTADSEKAALSELG